jgi:hypothetical protein
MPAPARKPQAAADRIESTQAALEAANRQLAELTERRNQCLLKDEDTAAAIDLGIKIANLKNAARAHEDRIQLLREQAAEEERARKAKDREANISKIEAKIDLRDKAMDDVAAAIKQLATASEKAISLGREVISSWTWAAHDQPAALLTPTSIMTAIAHESYRVSYRARKYGGQDAPSAGQMLPGARSPRLEWAEAPERVRPMLDVVREASSFAKEFLRTGKGSAGVEVAVAMPVINGGPRTEAEQKLASLLRRQVELSEDMSLQGEREYERVVEQIAKVQAEITAEKQMEEQRA